MQLAAIIVSLVLTVVGVALFARAIAQIYRFVRLGQNVPRGHPHRQTRPAHDHGGQGVPRPHPDEPLGRRRRRALVRRGRLLLAAPHPGQRPRPALQGRLGAAGHRRLAAVQDVRRVHRRADDARHPGPDRHPPAQPAGPRRAASPASRAPTPARRTSSRPSSSSSASASWRCAPWRARCTTATYKASYFVSYPLVAGFRGLEHRHPAEPRLPVRQLKITTSFVWMITVALKTDMGVAWHRFLAFPNIWFKRERTAAPRSARSSRCVGRQADRLRGPGRGRRLRRLADRALLLEGHPRLLHLHRVRALPVAVPRLEHRQAALAEAPDHVPARPRPRQGPVPARGRRQGRRGQEKATAEQLADVPPPRLPRPSAR